MKSIVKISCRIYDESIGIFFNLTVYSSSVVEKFMSQWKWYVYIIECMDGTYYTGLTWKPELRFEQHKSGLGGNYTAKHGVKGLVYLEEHTELELARKRRNK